MAEIVAYWNGKALSTRVDVSVNYKCVFVMVVTLHGGHIKGTEARINDKAYHSDGTAAVSTHSSAHYVYKFDAKHLQSLLSLP
eukprot:scaffold225535_cov43-Prasinocladus_malaysianus.AAC.1